MHSGVKRLLLHFRYCKLSGRSRTIVQTYKAMAESLAKNLPESPETTVCIRKLLESKEAAVRSLVEQEAETHVPCDETSDGVPEPIDDEQKFIDVVFDGPPSAESGRFVEVENAQGQSINIGQWVDRGDGYRVLRLRGES